MGRGVWASKAAHGRCYLVECRVDVFARAHFCPGASVVATDAHFQAVSYGACYFEPEDLATQDAMLVHRFKAVGFEKCDSPGGSNVAIVHYRRGRCPLDQPSVNLPDGYSG